jgi:hypothetical protein
MNLTPEPEEGVDERLLRELAERVRCERLRNNLQRTVSRLQAKRTELPPGPILAPEHGV